MGKYDNVPLTFIDGLTIDQLARRNHGGGDGATNAPRAIFLLCWRSVARAAVYCGCISSEIAVGDRAHTVSYIIRIHSDRKWPERIVYDASLPTIIPAQVANMEESAAAPATIAPAKAGSGKHLRNCDRQMPTSYNHPIQKSENRSCSANAK